MVIKNLLFQLQTIKKAWNLYLALVSRGSIPSLPNKLLHATRGVSQLSLEDVTSKNMLRLELFDTREYVAIR